jgi:hypothetical protein
VRSSQNELARILELREAALALLKRCGRDQGSGFFRKTVATHAGVRVSYWPERRSLCDLPSAGPGLAKSVELTDTKLPPLLNIDHKSAEMFGRVMSLEWDENGNMELLLFHPGEWESLLKAGVSLTMHWRGLLGAAWLNANRLPCRSDRSPPDPSGSV